MARYTSKAWLINMQQYLTEMLREAENEGWHHVPDTTVEGRHYAHIVRILEALDAQISWLPTTVKLNEAREAPDGMGRWLDGPSDSGRGGTIVDADDEQPAHR